LVIAGNQARVVADYTVPPPAKQVESAKAAEPVKADATASEPKLADTKPPEPAPTEPTQTGPTQMGPTRIEPIETAAQPAEAKPAAPTQDDKPVVPAKPADSSTP
jgi:hypothetical protein